MRTRVQFIAAIVATLLCSRAEATDVFGVVLGAPLTVPKCPIATIDGFQNLDEGRITSMCAYDPTNGTFPDPTYEIHFAPGSRPTYIKFGYFDVSMKNGAVDTVQIFTQGISVQSIVLAELKSKFGKPFKISMDKEENAYGATFDVINASWVLPTAVISFFGTVGDVDSGVVVLETPDAAARGRQQMNSAPHM